MERVSRVRRDFALATVLFVALLIDAVVGPEGRGVTALGVVVALLATMPLAARSRWPVRTAIVLTAAAALVVQILKSVDVVALPAIFALFTVAATGDRRRSLLAAACVTIAVTFIVVSTSPPPERLTSAAMNIGPLLAALALGDAVRWRTAYRAAVRRLVDEAITEERLRIARDLHDSIAHAITAISVQAGAAAHLIDRQPDAARSALLNIRQVSGEALGELRGTLGELREGEKASLRPAPSIENLDDLAVRVREAGVELSLTYEGNINRVTARVDAAAYRIVQEALTNVLRHSGARSATVAVTVSDTHIVLDIDDDGGGADRHGSIDGEGFGLLGMRERAHSVGGSIDASPRTGAGWRVHADLPLTPT